MKIFVDEAEFPGEPAGAEHCSTLIRCIMDIYKINALQSCARSLSISFMGRNTTIKSTFG